MLFAVSETVFFLLLASLLGGAAGWWLARSGRISVTKAMDRSGAHAAADRELVAARAEIERLSTKLAVATEAIRELEAPGGETAPNETAVNPVIAEEIPEAPAPPVELRAVTDDEATTAESADEGEEDVADDEIDEPAVTVEDTSNETAEMSVAMDADDEDPGSSDFIVKSARARGGKRLSERVAEASVFSRPRGGSRKIEFEGDADSRKHTVPGSEDASG